MIGSTKPSKALLRPSLIGVCGGSGSGKTTFARALVAELGPELCSIVYQDSFYRDQSLRFDRDGGSVNFDHPDAIDFAALATCLSELKAGAPTQIPIYDFVTHQRKADCEVCDARPVVVVDGILIFQSELVRSLFDELIYFDTPEKLRFERRLERDVRERGRTADGVRAQFFAQVKPMHDQYVEPSKQFADRIIRDQADFGAALQALVTRMRTA